MTARDVSLAAALLATGTPLRDALDAVVAAGEGALVVIGDELRVDELGRGGFRLDAEFTPQALYQLCKMDGAVLLDESPLRIRAANVHLAPDPALPTAETGVRHRTAEQLSLATDAVVVAVSERRGTISVYSGGDRLVARG